jgi:hypothetical protein
VQTSRRPAVSIVGLASAKEPMSTAHTSDNIECSFASSLRCPIFADDLAQALSHRKLEHASIFTVVNAPVTVWTQDDDRVWVIWQLVIPLPCMMRFQIGLPINIHEWRFGAAVLAQTISAPENISMYLPRSCSHVHSALGPSRFFRTPYSEHAQLLEICVLKIVILEADHVAPATLPHKRPKRGHYLRQTHRVNASRINRPREVWHRSPQRCGRDRWPNKLELTETNSISPMPIGPRLWF